LLNVPAWQVPVASQQPVQFCVVQAGPLPQEIAAKTEVTAKASVRSSRLSIGLPPTKVDAAGADREEKEFLRHECARI
jgi:hypothetical protein